MAIISFAFWIQNCKTKIGLHYVWFYKKTCFTGTAATYDQNIQVAPVFSAIKAYPYILCENLVHEVRLLSVLPVHSPGIAPLCRAVLLASPVVAACGEPDANTHGIREEAKQNSLQAAKSPFYMPWF